jgi:hypothetical protein
MFKPYISTSFTSIRHILLILKLIPVIFVTLDAPRKGLKNLFNVQRVLTNVEKVIKLYLQRFFTYLFTYYIKITICSFFNKHSPIFLSHILTQKGIPLDYIKTTFSLLVITLYYMSSM